MRLSLSAIFLAVTATGVAADAVTGAGPALNPTFESAAALSAQSPIDARVFGRLKRLDIQPAHLSSDAVFLRRAFLDVIGTLPTAQEASQFLADPDPAKRAALIDRLLERPEFADYWAMKWCDLLRVKAEFPINLWPNAAQAYHHWIRAAIRENQPYDRFVRDLLTSSGSNFREAPVNFYRAMQSKEPSAIAQTVALTFMGTRAENWPPERLAAMAGFFSQIGYKETGEWKEEIVYCKMGQALPPANSSAVAFPDGTPARLAPGRDPREVFADWLTAPQNPWFARNAVNRIWSWLLGRGIIQEPDDIRPDNPPSNPELLAFLDRELVASHYNLKSIYRLILNSQTYQLSAIPRSDSAEAAANFAYYPLRRLDAEVLADAICETTGTTETYTSAIPEPFTFIPEEQRAISLPDGSITSAFLELFGRPSRDTGLEAERNNRLTAAQQLHMLNASHVERKIEQSPKFQFLIRNSKGGQALVTGLYLMILSRPPTAEELQAVNAYGQKPNLKPREAVNDLAWALMNSAEFLYRH
jgi:Protein of unknown function (DUF1553)/Protein of unknown function (DUF1549)